MLPDPLNNSPDSVAARSRSIGCEGRNGQIWLKKFERTHFRRKTGPRLNSFHAILPLRPRGVYSTNSHEVSSGAVATSYLVTPVTTVVVGRPSIGTTGPVVVRSRHRSSKTIHEPCLSQSTNASSFWGFAPPAWVRWPIPANLLVPFKGGYRVEPANSRIPGQRGRSLSGV